MRLDGDNHVAQALTVAQLTEHHNKQLVPAGEMLHVFVSAILADDVVEMVPVKECRQLGEYVF